MEFGNILLLASVFLAQSSDGQVAGHLQNVTGPPEQLASDLLHRHNVARAKHMLPPLRIDATLNSTAQKFAQFVSRAKNYDHYADGQSPADRIEAEGYHWATWSENIAWGTDDPGEVFSGWMNSKSHRKNVLDKHQEVGFGYVSGVWIAVYATKLTK